MNQVDKEDSELLYWAFHQTQIPSVIDRKSKGEKLHLLDIGDFSVEWHMAGDLKTLKCMYNIPSGASCKLPCLYCMAPPHALDAEQQLKKPSRTDEDVNF